MKWDEILATIPLSLLADNKYEYLCDHFIQRWLKQPLTCKRKETMFSLIYKEKKINDSILGQSYIKQIEAPFKGADESLTHTLAHPSYYNTLPYIVASSRRLKRRKKTSIKFK